MEYFILIAVIAGLGYGISYFENNFRFKKTAFYKLRQKVQDDLDYAKFNNDWRKEQDARLKLLWLETKLKDERSDALNAFLGKKEDKSEYEVMKGITGDELTFPKVYDSEDFLHKKFAEEVTQAYAKLWANDFDYKNLIYKPESVLPLPKEEIKKAALFFVEHGHYPEKMKENIQALLVYLDDFIPIESDQLPLDLSENLRIGGEWERRMEETKNS